MLSALLGIASLGSHAAEEPTEKELLVVEMKDGTKQNFDLDERPRVTFGESTVTISTSDFQANFDKSYEEVKNITFQKGTPTGLDTTKAANRNFGYKDGVFTAGGIKEGEYEGVFSIDGMKIDVPTSTDGANISIDFRQTAPGVYIIRINKQSFKINKR